MNFLAILVIGLLAGLLLSLVAVGVCLLAYLTWQTRKDLQQQRSLLQRALAHSATTTAALRSDVTAALANLDADRLHEASQGVQLGAKRLQAAVNSLHKIVYAAGADGGTGSGSATSPTSLLDPLDPDYTPGMDPLVNSIYSPPPSAIEDEDVELQTLRGISSMDRIAIAQARQAGRQQIVEDRMRMRAEQSNMAQQQAATALNPVQSDVLTQVREELLAAGIDPMQVLRDGTMTDHATRSRTGALPDLGDFGDMYDEGGAPV